jgi:hypothetical protein
MTTIHDIPADRLREVASTRAFYTFDGAEEIGSSDISCCARDACRELGLDPDQMPREDFLVVRREVQDALREKSR